MPDSSRPPLFDVKELFETTNLNTANWYLKHGWALLDTYKTTFDHVIAPNDVTLHYVLAWAQGTAPVHPDRSAADEDVGGVIQYGPERK